jgi:phage gp29-like protein
MRILGYEIGRVKEMVNVDKTLPKSQNIAMKVIQRQSTRVTQDITKWRRAINTAESTIIPDRKDLQILFNEIHFDAHIAALINHLKQYLQSTEWCVKDPSSEEEDEEAEKSLNDKWFQDFINECINAKIYGYSLINFGDIKDNKFVSIESIDRRYIIPELNGMKKDLWNSTDLIDYTAPNLKNWVLFIGEKGDLGLLNKAAPYWIYKKQALSSWAEYQQILGIPPRIGKTDIRDNDRRINMTQMLRDMGHASYGVFDKDDSFEFVSPNGTGQSENAFAKMIDYLNKELSKLFVGQTMTTEDGSSRSQSETHADMFEMIMQGYKQFITDIVNRDLKPILLYHGIWKNPNLMFSFEEREEEITYEQKIQTLDILGKYITLTPEIIQELTGLEVDEVAPKSNQVNDTPLNRLKNYYGLEDFKHECDNGC